ncbi:MAG: stalk domain-containing protein [Firmicutes bacterium]|jgi:hypothetical protein|nr:stalk domain-containing protein [Bacillota bacterium]
MKKKVYILVLTISLMIMTSLLSFADFSATLLVNDEIVATQNQILVNENTVLVPIQDTLEAMDMVVRFDDTTNTYFIYHINTVFTMPVDSNKIVVQSSETSSKNVELGTSISQINSCGYMSLMDINKLLPSNANWSADTKTASISYEVVREFKRVDFETGYFEGFYRNGFKDGQGKLVWNSGDSYEGNWKRSKKHGYGVYTWSSGSKYEGNWVNDNMHGKATFTWSNGDVFVGNYVNDKMSDGMIRKANGSIIYLDENGQQTNEKVDTAFSTFRQKAFNGPSYNELLKNSMGHLNEATYFKGKILQAVQNQDGSNFFLMDTASGTNALISSYNTYSTDPNYVQQVQSKILAVFSDTPVDAIKDDNVKFYGTVLQPFTYQTVDGRTMTVPAIKVHYFHRYKRVSESMDDILKNGVTDINEQFRNKN